MSDVRAALRDASFYRTHRVTDTAPTTWHVPCYHVIREDEPYTSACGRPIASFTETAADAVVHRCQRPGCKQRWPAVRVSPEPHE